MSDENEQLADEDLDRGQTAMPGRGDVRPERQTPPSDSAEPAESPAELAEVTETADVTKLRQPS